MFDACKTLFQPDQGDKPPMGYFMECKITFVDFDDLLLISIDVKVKTAQHEELFMSFLVYLASKYDTAID